MMTEVLKRGENPFSLEMHPLMNNNYGFLYNLIVLPFAILFGNTLAIHRLISIFFIFLSALLIFGTLRKTNAARSFSAAGSMIVSACLLFSSTPLARPDSLGVFLFLATVFIPWQRKFDPPSLTISAVVGILAFLAKPYFLLGIGVVGSYVFLFVSKKRALCFGLITAGMLSITLVVINTFMECFVLDTLLNNMANSNLSAKHLKEQTMKFVLFFLPCIAITVLSNHRYAQERNSQAEKTLPRPASVSFFRFNGPLVAHRFNYFLYFLLIATIPVISLLGRHLGAHQTYFFQLMTPPLILTVFQKLDLSDRRAWLSSILTAANLFLLCFAVLLPNQLTESEWNEWKEINEYVGSSHRILNSPVLVPEMIELGMVPVDSGQSEYFYFTKPYESFPFAPHYNLVLEQGQAYQDSIHDKVQNQYFDRIIINQKFGFSPFVSQDELAQYYYQVKILTAAMPQTGQVWIIEVWEPKK